MQHFAMFGVHGRPWMLLHATIKQVGDLSSVLQHGREQKGETSDEQTYTCRL